MNNVLVLLFFTCIALPCLLTKRRSFLLAASMEDDGDIKIAGGNFSAPNPTEDLSELAARDFLRQKESGNIDRARTLGKEYARALLEVGEGPLAGEIDGKPDQTQHHQYLLYTYAVNRVIAELSPNSILAQTSLNVFYDEIEQASQEIYRHVEDTVAFSLYILCERSKNRTDDEIGRIFAGLCGDEADETLVAYGNKLYQKMYDFCAEKVRNACYLVVEGERKVRR